MSAGLFKEDNPLAARQAKTDRLILDAFVDAIAFEDDDIKTQAAAAHPTILRWAELETAGKLESLNETKLQGEFVSEVFGEALGYVTPTAGSDHWTIEREQYIAGKPADAIIGDLPGNEDAWRAVVELKGAKIHLDRDRSNGRTAVDQCWDYLVNTPPTCRFGIVSNFVSFRLYERSSTKRRYEHYSLQSLKDLKTFTRFVATFGASGLLRGPRHSTAITPRLLKQTTERQRVVGEELYQNYSKHRIDLIRELHVDRNHDLPTAIEYAQRLFDRVIFIAFCEDRGLLPEKTLRSAYESLPGFTKVTNPRWQNFKALFNMVDTGGQSTRGEPIPAYNGGLFAAGPVDDLELSDDYTAFFKTLGGYDFADEVNLDVLGHLFESSITEIERLKETGFFSGDADKAEQFAQMPQSAKRKRLGIYYTPPELTSRIVEYTVDELIAERFAEHADDPHAKLENLKNLKIVDPACGSGAFLFQAYDALELRYGEVFNQLPEAEAAELFPQIPRFILEGNLYGVDLSPEAVEITQLALWIRSADRSQPLTRLSRNIVHGNSLVGDPDVSPHAFDWQEHFPEVFEREESGFDCVIGNPPWERIKLQEREFFSLPAPEIATASNAAKRRQMVAKLESDDPALYGRYTQSKQAAQDLLDHCRKSGDYPLCGRGDINTYAVFAELASKLVAPSGRVGLLVPSGIVSDKTTSAFFASIAETDRLIRLYDFENKKVFFPDVHASFKFSILNFGGDDTNTDAADFVFFAHAVEELEQKKRHIALSGDDIKLLNPNTRTCPIFRSNRDAEITKGIYRRVPVLIDKGRKKTGNAWGISFKTMFHQTNDAEHFREAAWLTEQGYTLDGNRWTNNKDVYLPLYEAKMVQMFDHRAADVVVEDGNWVRQGQTRPTSVVEHQNPEHFSTPRAWVDDAMVSSTVNDDTTHFLAFKDVTSPTNQRTMIAACLPRVGVVNSAPIMLTSLPQLRQLCLLANLNSFAWDFVVRQKISNVHLNFFIVEQVPTLPPDRYDEPCPWDRKTKLEDWIAERVLKLTCTAEDMLPLADACGFTAGSFAEYDGRLHKWNERERAELMAELDAAYFHLYGLDRDDAEYVLSTFKGIHDAGGLFGKQSRADFILELYDGMTLQT